MLSIREVLYTEVKESRIWRAMWRTPRLRLLQRELNEKKPPFKIVLGTGTTRFPGWVCTDIYTLDVTNGNHWVQLFKVEEISHLLAEHVFEHLSESECRTAFHLCHHYLQPGGLLRVAVPDGYRRDDKYVEEVAPPHHGHKILFTVDTLASMLEDAGFHVQPLQFL